MNEEQAREISKCLKEIENMLFGIRDAFESYTQKKKDVEIDKINNLVDGLIDKL